ncbi:MAG: PD40 domain-containing protein, partial [Candidatus Aminicenantes bacterium]
MKPKAIYGVILLCIIFLFFSYAQQDDFPILKGPYLGQKPPGMTPEVFAPRIISTTEYTELGCTFSPDGKEFYFTRFTPDRNIWVCRLKDEVWQKPEPASFNSNYR